MTKKTCGYHPSRRRFLREFGKYAGVAAMAKAGALDLRGQGGAVRGTAKKCIFLNLNGAPSHLDTFDLKDAAWNPADASIEQFAGGVTLNRTLFPSLARHGNDLTVLRSVVSWEAAHERGQFYLQTGHPSNPAFVAETPHIGAVVSLELDQQGSLPPFMAMNGNTRGATFLGGRFEPFSPPVGDAGLEIVRHDFFNESSQQRFEEKFALLQSLDASFRANPWDSRTASHAEFYDSAKSLMYDAAIEAVFQFTPQDDGRYGGSEFGQACIVARNAVQSGAGASFISIDSHGWDTHQSMWDGAYQGNMYELCAELDTGVGALVDDLKASGHLDETLIVMMGEFGRTPGELNGRGGRDHHRDAMSVAMIGGGAARGRVIGATDANGDQVSEPGWFGGRQIYTEDIFATIYSALGIDWTNSITDTPSGRRFEYVPLAADGVYMPVNEVFA